MKIILILIMLLPFYSNAGFVKGDESLDFICEDIDKEAKPYSHFDLTFMYDDAFGLDLLELISDENLASGNGSLAYQMKTSQFPYYGAGTVPVEQSILGCEAAVLKIDQDKDEKMFNIYFECDADGDAGYGNLTVDLEKFIVRGKINFPESKQELIYPLAEDTEIEVSCISRYAE